MTDLDIKVAEKLSTRASKSLEVMRAKIVRAVDARTDAAHQARSAQVATVAHKAATDSRGMGRPRHSRHRSGA